MSEKTEFTQDQVEALYQALLIAYGDRGDLERLIQFGLNEDLSMLPPRGAPLKDVVYELIKWSVPRGRLMDLFREARLGMPGNRELNELARQMGIRDEPPTGYVAKIANGSGTKATQSVRIETTTTDQIGSKPLAATQPDRIDIQLDRWAGDYAVRVVGFSESTSGDNQDASVDLVKFKVIRITLADFFDPAHDATYSNRLSDSLLADPAEKANLETIARNLPEAGEPLRVFLSIGAKATDLNRVQWELLRDPTDETRPFVLHDDVVFSRFVDVARRRPAPRQAQRPVATIFIGPLAVGSTDQNGTGGQNGRSPGTELARVTVELGDIAPTAPAPPGRPTLADLIARLDANPDILYLICHVLQNESGPLLQLEDEEGKPVLIPAQGLVEHVRSLPTPPSLLVMRSPDGADGTAIGADRAGALLMLGAELVAAGFSAALVIPEHVDSTTVDAFMPPFFRALLEDGQVDRATGVARRAVATPARAAMPVLFNSLRDGKLWTVARPAGTGTRKQAPNWSKLLADLKLGHGTPILGPGIVENIVGSTRKIAREWADEASYPLSQHSREDLAQVAQYLAMVHGKASVRRSFLARYPKLPPAADPLDPHRVLARIRFPLYITTNPDPWLAKALEDAGRPPIVDVCRWKDKPATLPAIFAKAHSSRPSEDNPLVYHLFGHAEVQDLLVLTEDDHLDFLANVKERKRRIPPYVVEPLANTSLLFLGFRMDDWTFRVLLRSLKKEGSERGAYRHIGVQIDEMDDSVTDKEAAQEFFESYFEDDDVTIYWGSITKFVKELAEGLPVATPVGGES